MKLGKKNQNLYDVLCVMENKEGIDPALYKFKT